MLESGLERKCCNLVKKLGGLAYKWVSPGATGVPDRIFILTGRVIFVEFKRPGSKDGRSARQKKVFYELSKRNQPVWLISDFDAFRSKLRELGYEV